jgi:hypothetical protein
MEEAVNEAGDTVVITSQGTEGRIRRGEFRGKGAGLELEEFMLLGSVCVFL